MSPAWVSACACVCSKCVRVRVRDCHGCPVTHVPRRPPQTAPSELREPRAPSHGARAPLTLDAALCGCARVLARRTRAHGRSAAARGSAAAALHCVVGGCVLARLRMVETVYNGSVYALERGLERCKIAL
jgi:hypothetical protein